ncbi:DcaP family trimeric outer membrane transporter [Acinetobacter sp. YH12100]|uniref:DcaP family trimeric outer membrane transporter n=1 Tax=Acinetobacter sp. YH12100 TaxID=2601089 RepID=UPI0015D13CA0|nr:DcaP family trimeric outer membrane transporter [Acinetobacter sp. YH12100]
MNTTLFTTTINKPTRKHTLLMSMIAISMGSMSLSVQAQTTQSSQQEIEQLRQEVQALRALVEQQQRQTAVVTAHVAATPAPASKPVMKIASGAEFNLYGNIRADASYQVEGTSRDLPYNHINAVALEGNNENSDRLRSTLSATRLGMDFKAPIGAGDKALSGKVEVDFLGGASFDNLRIRHAYISYANWLIGQTWSNFAVPDYMPETVDALAYVGGAVKRTPQVRYTTKFSPQTNLVVAAEDPKDKLVSDKAINQRFPALTARLNHQFADNLNVSVRAMGHEKRIDTDEEMAWGVGVGTKYEVVPGTTIKADYYHVKGDNSFVSFANPGVLVKDGNLIQSEFDSITVGLTQQFNDKLRGTLGYGYMKFDDDQDYINALSNKSAANKDLWQAWANIFYSPRKPLSFGLEYVYGERKAYGPVLDEDDQPVSGRTGEDNRINAVAIYNF